MIDEYYGFREPTFEKGSHPSGQRAIYTLKIIKTQNQRDY